MKSSFTVCSWTDTKLRLGTLLHSYPPYPLSPCKTDLLVFAELCYAAGPRDNLSAGNYLPHLEDNDLSFKFSSVHLSRLPYTAHCAPEWPLLCRINSPTPHTVTFFSRLLRRIQMVWLYNASLPTATILEGRTWAL